MLQTKPQFLTAINTEGPKADKNLQITEGWQGENYGQQDEYFVSNLTDGLLQKV